MLLEKQWDAAEYYDNIICMIKINSMSAADTLYLANLIMLSNQLIISDHEYIPFF